jgi:hypothetical protein
MGLFGFPSNAIATKFNQISRKAYKRRRAGLNVDMLIISAIVNLTNIAYL